MPNKIGPTTWRVAHGRELKLSGPPLIMGILNVTPDSFSDGGLFADPDSAVAQGRRLVHAGADIVDVGAESTRPGSQPVSPQEQIRRALPVIEQLARQSDAAISVDTRSAEVARAALDAGAHIVNDISALRDDERMAATVARRKAGLVLMHRRGTPADMQDDPRYEDVVAEVGDFLADRARFAIGESIPRESIVIDPGIGFGKTTTHNLQLLANLDRVAKLALGLPVLVGPSRKRFIGELLDAPVNERLAGTLAACVMAVARGARLVRVHDPGPVRQALRIAWHIRGQRGA